MATFCYVCYCSYNIGVLSTCSFLKRFKTTKLGETKLNRRCCSVFFEENPVFILQLREVVVEAGLDERIC